jgi:hypothetical protein
MGHWSKRCQNGIPDLSGSENSHLEDISSLQSYASESFHSVRPVAGGISSQGDQYCAHPESLEYKDVVFNLDGYISAVQQHLDGSAACLTGKHLMRLCELSLSALFLPTVSATYHFHLVAKFSVRSKFILWREVWVLGEAACRFARLDGLRPGSHVVEGRTSSVLFSTL